MRETTVGRWIFGRLILCCALLGAGCLMIAESAAREEWRASRVVQVKGIEQLCNYPPSWCVKARAGRPTGVLARDGDLLYFGDKNPFLRYRETDGKSLVLEGKDEVLLLNGKAVSIRLSDKGTGWDWLRKASIEDLAGLRLLEIKENAEAHDFPLLEKLARLRPDIGLFLDIALPDNVAIDQPDVQEKLNQVARLVSLFEPDLLFISSRILSARFDALAPRLGNVEVLVTSEEPPWDFLPQLPRLRALTIIGGKRVENLSFLRNVRGLQELVLWEFDELKASALTEPDPLMLAGTDPGSAQL